LAPFFNVTPAAGRSIAAAISLREEIKAEIRATEPGLAESLMGNANDFCPLAPPPSVPHPPRRRREVADPDRRRRFMVPFPDLLARRRHPAVAGPSRLAARRRRRHARQDGVGPPTA